MYRMVVLDLDGTTLNEHGQISPRVQSAVARAMASGVAVTIATGRRWRSALGPLRILGIRLPVVLHNGAVVADPAAGMPLAQHGLAPHAALAAAQFLADHGCAPCFSCHSADPTRPDLLYHRQSVSPAAGYFLREDPGTVRQVDDLAEGAAAGPLRVFALDRTEQVAAAARALPAEIGSPHEHLVAPDIAGHTLIEFRAPGINKATGVQFLAHRLGIRRTEIIAIGDNRNDLELIQWAGLGVAMGNAVPDLQAAADMITAANTDDGVAAVLERCVLGEVA